MFELLYLGGLMDRDVVLKDCCLGECDYCLFYTFAYCHDQ